MDDPRVFDLNKFKKIPNNIPYLLGIAYFFGFIIVNSFLVKYNFTSINLLNTEYLIAGIIFSLIFGSIVLSIYFSNRKQGKLTDSAYDFFLPALMRVLVICFATSFITINYNDISDRFTIVINLIVLIYFLLLMLLNTEFAKNKINYNLNIGLRFAYLIFVNIYIFYHCDSCRSLMILCFIVGIGVLIVFSEIFDKTFHKVQAIGLIFIAIVFSSYFGTSVYEDIPRKYGGRRAYKTQLLVESKKLTELKNIISVENNLHVDVQILYETEHEYLIKKDSSILVLNKSFFCGSKTLK